VERLSEQRRWAQAVGQSWEALRFASAVGADSRDVALTAVAAEGKALQYVSARLQDDDGVAGAAVVQVAPPRARVSPTYQG
jgi:hypothetical protein